MHNKQTLEANKVDLNQVHHFSDNLYSKEIHIPADHVIESHSHEYSHLSILAKGRCIVETDSSRHEYTAPACIEIKAGVIHQVQALDDVVWFCTHSIPEGLQDKENIDEVLIKKLPFERIDFDFNVQNLADFLMIGEGKNLFGKYDRRSRVGSPHEQMTDIWVRFNDPAPFVESGDWSKFVDNHDSVWLEDIPDIKTFAYFLMQLVEGSKLGGVLITKLPPGGRIHPHVDDGWHAEEYDKYFIPIVNEKGARFHFDNGVIEANAGEIYKFRNDVNHWVENDSEHDRIALIVCIK